MRWLLLLVFAVILASIMVVLTYWPLQTMLVAVGYVLGVNAGSYTMGTKVKGKR